MVKKAVSLSKTYILATWKVLSQDFLPNAGKLTAYFVVVGDGIHTIIQYIDL